MKDKHKKEKDNPHHPPSSSPRIVRERKPKASTIDPQAPDREMQGFVLYLVSLVATGVYVLWCFLGVDPLQEEGEEEKEPLALLVALYLPQRYWAVALPQLFFVVWFGIYCFYLAVAMMGTPRRDDRRCVTDAYGLELMRDMRRKREGRGKNLHAHPKPDSIPALTDLSIMEVNRVLYDQ
eukprot:Nk52_evm5s388 gene=Nk52_evmTU5s388